MPQTLSLNGDWSLAWHDDFPQFLTAETAPLRTQLTANIPEPVHQTLMRHGLLDDPRIGLSSLAARWVEEQFWVYRRAFTTPPSSPNPSSQEPWEEGSFWLVFDLLEYDAVIYLNGQEIGRHANAHRPARFEVSGKLRPEGEENTLVVRLDAGLYSVADKPAADYFPTPLSSLSKIHWMRKGQWQRGWDWQQRLMNAGILGDVRLEWSEYPIVTQCQVYTTVSDDLTTGTVHIRLAFENTGIPVEIFSLGAGILDTASKKHVASKTTGACLIATGHSVHEFSVEVNSPQLWWPVGHGEAKRYLVFVQVQHKEAEGESFIRPVGFRKVEVDQSAHPEVGKHFILKINNKPIFCKGGNWVPPDMLYYTVTTERLEELVDLAIGANFNLLRIWGGGTWAGHDLLELCDAKGILVWHDLLFACSKYPGDYPEWAAEARREVQWGMREFAHHPSLVVWCGNNEIEEGDWNWGYDRQARTHPHYALFHHDFPQLAKTEAPYAFYWISSPYSPDYESPTDPTVGDQHPWGVSLRQDGPTDWWEYRNYVDRFPNEGGVLGASSPATLKQFLPENQQYINSPAWDHHDNPFAMQPLTPGQPGRAYQTLTHWTGLHADQLDWETYAFASALLQAEGLTEYITNYRRRMFSSSAAIFWMFNDSWPTTHGWTIVDYYRRKKLAYHPVRRAFQPISIVVAADAQDQLVITGINESVHDWEGRLSWWVFGVRQTSAEPGATAVRLPANTATVLATLDGASVLRDDCGYAALLSTPSDEPIAQYRLFFSRFHELNLDPSPQILLTLESGILTLRSEVFVWGVCLDIDGESPVADNCFDLLPGVPYSLPWDAALLGEPKVQRTGNGLFATP